MSLKLNLQLLVFLTCSLTAFCQDKLSFSPIYESDNNNIPLQIINCGDHFYLLRYNKAVHDFTIEKRLAVSARQVKFINLKLDEVNSHSFDYQKLDQLFYEKNGKLFFVFEKVLDTKKTVYIKTIDSAGHASPFVLLSEMEKNDYIREFSHSFKKTEDGKLLITTKIIHTNNMVRKTVSLFDPYTGVRHWTKRIPDQYFTGNTFNFAVTPNNDLWYIKRMYIGKKDTVTFDTYIRDSLLLCYIPSSEKEPLATGIAMPKNFILHDGILISYKEGMLFFACIASPKFYSSDISKGFFYSEYFLNGLSLYSNVAPYDKTSEEKLTYFDGPIDDPGLKSFSLGSYALDKDKLYCIFEREDLFGSKDIFSVKLDLKKGRPEWMHVIPRRVIYSQKASTHKYFGNYIAAFSEQGLDIFFLDHSKNIKKDVALTSFSKTKKAGGLEDCNLVRVRINDSGIYKELNYYNSGYLSVPLIGNTEITNLCPVFFQTNRSNERFLFE